MKNVTPEMNLDDIDFEEEWEKFKSEINSSKFCFKPIIEIKRFWIKDHDNGTVSIGVGSDLVFNMDSKVMNMFKQLKLVVDDTTIGAVGFYCINPEEFDEALEESKKLLVDAESECKRAVRNKKIMESIAIALAAGLVFGCVLGLILLTMLY